jgi:hypothetical protein
LQFVGRRGGVIDVGGDFIKFSGDHDRLLGSPGVSRARTLDVIVTPRAIVSMAQRCKFLWLSSLDR